MTAAAQGAPSMGERDLALDWLRDLGICAVVLIHVCEVFNPWDAWHVANPERSRLAGEVVVFFAPWIMPLLMVLAGAAAFYALRRRTAKKFARERVTRLLVPLLVGILILVPPQVDLERRLEGAVRGSFIAFYPHFFEGLYPRGNLSWHHLWFLAHLFVYSLLALPLFHYWQTEKGRRQLRRIASWCTGPFGLFWLAVPLVLERHLLWGLLSDRLVLTSDWANHAILFVAYIYGYMLAAEPELSAAVDHQWKNALLLAGVISAGLWALAWRGFLPNGLPQPYAPGYLAFWSAYGIGAWAWIVALLGMMRALPLRDLAFLRWSRTRSYAWYLVHQPIVIAIAVVIIPLHWGPGGKFLAIGVATVAGTVAAAEGLQRIALTRRLFGLPSSVRPAQVARKEAPDAPLVFNGGERMKVDVAGTVDHPQLLR
jgi:surface polysaccharide O-acyltransferase-like enzyme